MPARKKPPSLQSSSLRRIGSLFKNTCQSITEGIIVTLLQVHDNVSYAHLKALKHDLLSDPVSQIQKCFFVDTPYYFHKQIVIECLVSLSELMYQIDDDVDETMNAYITPETKTLHKPARIRWKREILIEFLDIFCHPGAVIKAVHISIDSLGARWKLHRSVVTGLCDRLIHMPYLEELNLGHWSCRKSSLLADQNLNDGWPLEFLPCLKVLRLSDVSQKFFQSIGTFCPQLVKLHIFASDITDTVTWWVSKCQNLEVVELFEDRDVTPVGYAQLLRANSNLKSLGKCDCFGQVLFMLYDNLSLYRRSYSSMPEHLNLEEVDTNGALHASELKHLVKRCPNLRKIRFKYFRDREIFANNNTNPDNNADKEEQDHLAKLCALDHLTQLSITCANFYEHQVFHLLEVRGDQLVHLELIDIDEVNLNAILLLGAHCIHLQKLCLHGCHFQMQPEDSGTVDSICQRPDPGGRQKRLRLTSTASMQEEQVRPFEKLTSLDVYLKSPTHMPVFQLLVNQCVNVECLIFDQFYCDYEESLINRSLFEWSGLERLKELSIGHGSQLSIVTVNVILANCGQLRKLGRLDQWGKVSRHQIESIRGEIQARNFDLIIDAGDLI